MKDATLGVGCDETGHVDGVPTPHGLTGRSGSAQRVSPRQARNVFPRTNDRNRLDLDPESRLHEGRDHDGRRRHGIGELPGLYEPSRY